MRKKTHIEASEDNTLEKLSLKQVRELVGFYEPAKDFEGKECWTVTQIDDGYLDTATQTEAEIISSLEQIKLLLLKLLKKQ